MPSHPAIDDGRYGMSRPAVIEAGIDFNSHLC